MAGAMHSASGCDRIEVVTGVERRRRWSLVEKLKAVEESRLPGMSVSYVARKYGIAPSLLFVGESSWLRVDRKQCVATIR